MVISAKIYVNVTCKPDGKFCKDIQPALRWNFIDRICLINSLNGSLFVISSKLRVVNDCVDFLKIGQ